MPPSSGVRFTTRPMTGDDLPAAAAILAARQARLRALRPELPEAFTQPQGCRALLEDLIQRPGAFGVLLQEADRAAGYLLGHPRPEPIWGRACWSPVEGSALADGVPGEAIRDLYADWSEHFVRAGHFLHYVHAPADDAELMAAWVRTGFGQMQAHALRDLDMDGTAPSGIRLRRATPEDIDGLEPLLPLIATQLMRPPAFAVRLPEELPSYRESWLEELNDAEAHHWLAEEAGRPLAMASFYPMDAGPMVPDATWELAVAMTLPQARGRGLMRALIAAAFAELRDAGATCCETDWRTASLPTHRTWTALGWRPTHYRLHRHIDERIAWAEAAWRG